MNRIHGKHLMKAMILALLWILILLAGSAGAEKSGSTGELSWVLDDGGKLTVSVQQEDMDDEWVDWIEYAKEITSVVIGDGVTGIGENAFFGCKALKSIRLPESLTEIGDGAFHGCTSLQTLTIPSGVEEIGFDAFSGCTSLKSVQLPEGLTRIEEGTFKGCTSLQTLAVRSISEIGDEAFSGCKALKSVQLPEGLTRIGEGAFRDCTSLQTLTVRGIKEIGPDAFFGCTALKNVQLPKGLTRIGEGAFQDCSSLQALTIPNGIEEIGFDAFSRCTSLKSVQLPGSLTRIREGTFRGCTSLQTVTFSKGISEIIHDAFSYCAALKSVQLPEGLTKIGDRAFYECTSLQTLTISKGNEEIGNDAFSGCAALKSVQLPEGLAKIGERVFRRCSSLQSLTIPKSVKKIGYDAFRDCHEDFYLDVVKGSYAEKYAEENDISYSNGKKKTLNTGAKIRRKVNEIVSGCIRSGMSDREKALALHDWLIMNNHYDLTYTIHSPEGVLLRGSGVCQSYTEAYSLLCTRAGLANKVLSGQTTSSSSSSPGNHSWNLVRIDGHWYHIDCTWDDPVYSTEKVEVDNSPAVSGMESHEYFMLTDEQIKAKRHSWSSEYSADKGKIGRYNEPKFPVNGLDIYGNAIIWKNGLYRLTGNEAVFISPASKSLTELEIPDQIQISEQTAYPVTGIAENACKDLKKLKTLKIGKNVAKIGEKAFSGCKGLKTITIKSEKLTKDSIGKAAFKGVPAKATVKIPKKMFKNYQTLLIKSGISKKATFKKN